MDRWTSAQLSRDLLDAGLEQGDGAYRDKSGATVTITRLRGPRNECRIDEEGGTFVVRGQDLSMAGWSRALDLHEAVLDIRRLLSERGAK